MKNISFVVWILGWAYLLDHSDKSFRKDYTTTDKGIAALVELMIWFGVAYLLYER